MVLPAPDHPCYLFDTFWPALDIVIVNLELMPLRMNERKIAGIGDRQRDMVARRFLQAGLLSRKGLEPVLQ